MEGGKQESTLSLRGGCYKRGELKGRGEQLSPLKDEGQDGRAQRRVVAELLQVAAVFPLRPHSHLDETHQGEERHRQALRHQCEAQPGAQLQEGERCYTGKPQEGGERSLTYRSAVTLIRKNTSFTKICMY